MAKHIEFHGYKATMAYEAPIGLEVVALLVLAVLAAVASRTNNSSRMFGFCIAAILFKLVYLGGVVLVNHLGLPYSLKSADFSILLESALGLCVISWILTLIAILLKSIKRNGTK